MDGRFRKIDINNLSFVKGGGLYCNNIHLDILTDIMKDRFGKPNGNSLRTDESTWKYILEYQGIYLTIYDYNSYWSLGFLELKNVIPDYELIKAYSRMLYNFLQSLIEERVNTPAHQQEVA